MSSTEFSWFDAALIVSITMLFTYALRHWKCGLITRFWFMLVFTSVLGIAVGVLRHEAVIGFWFGIIVAIGYLLAELLIQVTERVEASVLPVYGPAQNPFQTKDEDGEAINRPSDLVPPEKQEAIKLKFELISCGPGALLNLSI